jgi:DNA-binding NtrC family response regulator
MTRILMLGGDPDVVEAGRTILIREGYTVAMARDIKDAVALRDHFQPNLLFIDVLGHDPADAVELAAAAQEGGLRIPILVMATKGRGVAFYLYFGDGALTPAPDFPEKPMEPDALRKNVRYALALGGTGGPPAS